MNGAIVAVLFFAVSLSLAFVLWYFSFPGRIYFQLDEIELRVRIRSGQAFDFGTGYGKQFLRCHFLLDRAVVIELVELQVRDRLTIMPDGSCYAGQYEASFDGREGVAWIYSRKNRNRVLAVPLRTGELLVLGVSDPDVILRTLRHPMETIRRFGLA